MAEFWNAHQEWIIGLGTLIGALLAITVLHRVAYYIAGRLAHRTPSIVDDSLIRRTHAPTYLIVLLITFAIFLPGIPISADRTAIFRRLVALALTGALGWLLITAIGTVKDYVGSRFDITNVDNLRARQVWTQTQILHRIAVGTIAILTVCIMLMSIPNIRQIGVSLFASAGVAGLVIGMAAQQMLKNLIAGVQIALTEPIRVHDVVIVEGEWGTIEEIRATYIVVKIWDLRRLVVPLSYFIEKPFQNWTRRTADLLGTIFWYVDYTVPVDRVREQMKAIVKSNPLWDGNVCVLQVTDVKDSTIELRGLVSAANSGNTFDLRCQVRESMIQWLQREYPRSLPRLRADLYSEDHGLRDGDGAVPEARPRPS